MTRSLVLKWCSVFIVASFLYTLAPSEDYSNLPLYLTLTGIAVVIWVFDLLPAIFVAALLTFAYLITNLASPEVVFSPWTTVLIWITFGAAIFGEAMQKTGLAKRMALRCLLITGGTFPGLLIGLGISGVLLGLIVVSGFARTVIFCSLGLGIIQALELDKKSRMASLIMLACFFSASEICYEAIHTSESFIWAFDVLLKSTNKTVGFWKYASHMTLPVLIYAAFSFFAIWLCKGSAVFPDGDKLKAILRVRLSEMGPMSKREKKLLILALVSVAGFMLEPWTNINAVWLLCISALFCYMPGMNIVQIENFDKLNIFFLVFVAGCMAIGTVATSVGANDWAVKIMMPFFTDIPIEFAIFFAYLGGIIVDFLLTPFAAVVAFTPAFAELGVQTGIDPLPLFYAFNIGLNQYFFPYEGAMFLYLFTTGCVQLRHIMLSLMLRTLFCTLILICIFIPYWKLINLL